jgi:hypothetical protein
MLRSSRYSLLLLVALALASTAAAQSDAAMKELVRVAIRPYGTGLEATLADYRYRMHTVTSTVDKKGNVEDRDDEVVEVRWVDGAPEEKLIERNGKPPTEKDTEKADKRDEKRRKRKKSAHEDFRFGRDFLIANDFSDAGTALVSGRNVRVIRFAAKKKLPKGIDADDYKNIAGTLWIDTSGSVPQIVKLEFHLTGPRRFALVLASASEAQLNIEYTEPPDRAPEGQQPIAWLPKKLDFYMSLRVLGMKIRPKMIRDYGDFERVVPYKIRGKILTPGV